MRMQSLQVTTRKPAGERFGDMMLTDINMDDYTAVAHFSTGIETTVRIKKLLEQLGDKYNLKRVKKLYFRQN